MKLKLYALFCLTLFTTSAFAHAGHDHDHNEDAMDVEDVTEADFDFDSTESKPDVEPKSSVVKPDFKPTTLKAPFIEQFTADWKKRWFPSQAKKAAEGEDNDELLRYRGEWAVEEPIVFPAINNDMGLVVKTVAAHHAISHKFPKPIDPKDKGLVVQYEVKLQNGLECGGAYMKLLTENATFDAVKFDDKSPYTIMFGPDKCGSTNKVHFIFRHKNPKTGVIEEKHLKSPPSAEINKLSNLYTLIIKPDESYEILINGESKSKGSLLENFEPPVNPPKEIDDVNDKKPDTWVDQAKIPDPTAVKPEDWDEDAPMEIPDESAEKPEDWQDDEPEMIPDPEAVQPEDWDTEEDGDWVPPMVPNPKCESAGCGEWKRPKIRNPAYKGKWHAPLIDNPEYKGEWKPRQIPNPDYFEDLHPHNLNKIGALGFELWTMQNGILFDNIYVGYSEKDAKAFADETWAVNHKIEKELEGHQSEKSETDHESTKALEAASIIEEIKTRVLNFIKYAQQDPVKAASEDPAVAGGLITTLAVLFGLLLTTGKPKKIVDHVEKKKKPQEIPSNSDSEETSKTDSPSSKTEKSAIKKRGAKKDTDDDED